MFILLAAIEIIVVAVIVMFMLLAAIGIIVGAVIVKKKYDKLEREVLETLGFENWNIISYFDEIVFVKSRQSLEKYDDIKFFKENNYKIIEAKQIIRRKKEIADILKKFLSNNEYKNRFQYNKIVNQINMVIKNAGAYRILVNYKSPAGNDLGTKEIIITQYTLNKFENDPLLLMSKGEYSKYLKEKQKEALEQKQHQYYDRVNQVIDYADKNRENLFLKSSKGDVDALVLQLFDRTVNSIKKIKSIDSEEWGAIERFIDQIEKDIHKIVHRNQKILEYYQSSDFLKIKDTCEVLMSTQRDFNEYIIEKVESISCLFGIRIVRNETINEDEYNYIRPYRKSVTPFTAEVSAIVFASAENNPLEYVIKYFYPNKNMYPEQIQKLHLLLEELATLKDARKIIENYKIEYHQYLKNVPDYVMEEDESGFYSRLGFANIDETTLIVEYVFSYTSSGGMAKRTFTVPMTEETIVELIRLLEEKLTLSAFTKQQRALMTSKLRESILIRDNYTCCNCENSIHLEPNLLLEIDHIIPISKGGYTVEDNLQTLCWKCNRAKSNKIV